MEVGSQLHAVTNLPPRKSHNNHYMGEPQSWSGCSGKEINIPSQSLPGIKPQLSIL